MALLIGKNYFCLICMQICSQISFIYMIVVSNLLKIKVTRHLKTEQYLEVF